MAFVYENGLSGLSWDHVIAYGGTRVVVPDACLGRAREVLRRWQSGSYCLDTDDRCPRCHGNDIEENPDYRGWAFFFGCFVGLPIWPMLKWRERCNACGHRWKARPVHTYDELNRLATEAEARARPG